MTPLMESRALTLKAGGKRLVEALDWQIHPGEQWGILGPNGCGKSTLLHTLTGLVAPESGTILLGGNPLDSMSRREVARQAGLLFQENHYPFPLTVKQLVLAGRYPWQTAYKSNVGEDRDIVSASLSSMQLEDLAERKINELSGGERRRVALAALLTQDAAVSLLDEPENHLDPGVRLSLLKTFLDALDDDRQAAVMVLHDPTLAVRLCSHMLLLFDDGSYLHGPTGDTATEDNLTRLYGASFQSVETDRGTLFYPG